MKCLAPIQIRNPDYGTSKEYLHDMQYLLVPCGKCEACVQRKSSEWFVRLRQQQMSSGFCWFITLTYDDEHLPIRITDGKMYNDVIKQDCILYHKRLRQMLSENSKNYKYYLCAEYGGQYQRPHYHEIAFDIAKSDLPLLSKAWQNGFVKIDEVNDNRLRYVSGYILEKLFVPGGCAPVFNLISNGIGLQYVDKYVDFHKHLGNMYVPYQGKKLPMPRYYKDRLVPSYIRQYESKQIQLSADLAREEYLKDHSLSDLEKRNFEIRSSYIREVRERRNKHKRKF